MKSLAALLFLFLVVPGSGQLAWDGLPFSTRLEFATLVLFVVVVLNRETRTTVRTWLASKVWRSAVKPVLIVLALLKLLTFTWYPFSDGFDACYRSLYVPIETPGGARNRTRGRFCVVAILDSRIRHESTEQWTSAQARTTGVCRS